MASFRGIRSVFHHITTENILKSNLFNTGDTFNCILLK